jgi:hypothetical protein
MLLRTPKALEKLSIEVDTASTAGKRPHQIWNTYHIGLAISMNKFANLRFFELNGCELFHEMFHGFLAYHANTLYEMRIANCNLLGSWTDALRLLLDSKTMQYLSLSQLGDVWHRVEFPRTCRTYMTCAESGDWVYVSRGWHVVEIMASRNWKADLSAVIQDIRVLQTAVDPGAEDALHWI